MLSVFSADKAVVIEPNIEVMYKELKLRMLNTTRHTYMRASMSLVLIATVKDGITHICLLLSRSEVKRNCVQAIPCPLPDGGLLPVMDTWMCSTAFEILIWNINGSIYLQYSSKIKMQAIPVLLRYHELYTKRYHNVSRWVLCVYLIYESGERGSRRIFRIPKWQQYRISDDMLHSFMSFGKLKAPMRWL